MHESLSYLVWYSNAWLVLLLVLQTECFNSLIVENHKVLNLWKFYKLIIMKDESNQNVITFSILCSNLMCFSVLLQVLNISLHNFHAWVFLSLSVIFRCMAGPGLDRVSQTKYLLPWWCLKCSPRVLGKTLNHNPYKWLILSYFTEVL